MSYELSIKTHKDYRDCKCEHKVKWGKNGISDLIKMFNSFKDEFAQVKGLQEMKPILITCEKCKKKWILVNICDSKFILDQFRIYKNGSTKRYKTSRFGRHKVSTMCVIVSKGWKYIFSPKDEDY